MKRLSAEAAFGFVGRNLMVRGDDGRGKTWHHAAACIEHLRELAERQTGKTIFKDNLKIGEPHRNT